VTLPEASHEIVSKKLVLKRNPTGISCSDKKTGHIWKAFPASRFGSHDLQPVAKSPHQFVVFVKRRVDPMNFHDIMTKSHGKFHSNPN
jgi:hypothetical protein